MQQDHPGAGAVAEFDVLIVGAGICGLTAAAPLVASGLSVALFDKGTSVGGRLATRRVGPGRADHGAQFFTVRDERFARMVAGWREQNLVFRWSDGWSDGSLAARPGAAGHPRYAVQGGMNGLAKHLAAGLHHQGVHIETNVKIMGAMPVDGGWRVQDDSGRTWHCRGLVLTPPVPQSLALLSGAGSILPARQQAELHTITYAPCICGLCWVEGTVWLPAPGVVQRPDADITWIADNQRKGISPYAPIFTLHGSPEWSAEHYADPDEVLLETFCAALREWTSTSVHSREIQIKRWRYALPTVLYPAPYLCAGDLPPLYFGGDAFGSPRIEGAVLSGLELGSALAAELAGA